MVVYGLSMGATRALTGETFMNVHAADEPEVRQTVLGEVLGAAVAVGVASSVVAAVAAVDRRWLATGALLAVAVCLPLVLVHDTLRFVFVIDRAERALLIDVVWLVARRGRRARGPARCGRERGSSWPGAERGRCRRGGLRGQRRAACAPRTRGAWLVRSRRDGGRFLGEFVTAAGVRPAVRCSSSVGSAAWRRSAPCAATQVFTAPST